VAVMSLRAYARHRGCVHSAVRKAIATGRITARPDGRLESDLADRQWAVNTRTTIATGHATVSPARAVREHYEALLTKVEFEERAGRLVSKTEVQEAAFNKFRQLRDAMLNLPDRLSAAIAGEKDIEGIRNLLVTEILQLLGER
jgi:hypothetical protein